MRDSDNIQSDTDSGLLLFQELRGLHNKQNQIRNHDEESAVVSHDRNSLNEATGFWRETSQLQWVL